MLKNEKINFLDNLMIVERMIKVMINKIKNIIKNKWNREIDENDIRLEELKQLQKENTIIIDVRSPQEYKEKHIRSAILIPSYEINKNIVEAVCFR